MTDLEAFIADLSARGIQLSADGADLVARPRERLTANDRETLREHKLAILELLREAEDRCATPAESIIATCCAYGVALSIGPDGRLIVGGAAWPSLLMAIEAHREAVTALVGTRKARGRQRSRLRPCAGFSDGLLRIVAGFNRKFS
jgi:hypothetical protein